MPLVDLNGIIAFSPQPGREAESTFFICAAIAALALYDYLLTFSQEIEMIWRRPLTGASVLFMLNRYLSLVLIFLLGIPAENRTFFV
ncbi:hypothetical protein BDW22DRAFT_689002 [Trametopsis cervina]|nr:hypothetical protein BDW22DRAFT_689002 [Trametopsis cervina]